MPLMEQDCFVAHFNYYMIICGNLCVLSRWLNTLVKADHSCEPSLARHGYFAINCLPMTMKFGEVDTVSLLSEKNAVASDRA